MLPHWDTVIRPFLAALDSGPIIEIGAYSGETTVLTAEFAVEHDITLYVVDPDPRFDVAAFERRFAGHFQLHRGRSHDVLLQLEPAAAVLIDGDHNWYTVHGELKRLEQIAGERWFPLVMFHDVEWPYARRDMYWAPDAIPERWRKPWARDGIRWGRPLLDDNSGGISRGNAQAIEEGGAHNGVLTAVEDFIEESSVPLKLRIVNGDHGLGVLASRDVLDKIPAVRKQWDNLLSTEFLSRQARELSGVASMENASHREALDETERLKRELSEARKELIAAPADHSRLTSGLCESSVEMEIHPMTACNICGGQEFVPGPNGRLTQSGAPPQCGGCRSLERQRSLYECLSRIPSERLSWRRAIQFAPDASVNPAWFRSFEKSSYDGENSIDLQKIDRPGDSYDFISLSSVLEFVPDDRQAFDELMRIGSTACIMHCTFLSTLTAPSSTHYGEPHGNFGRYHDYGSDLAQWFNTNAHGLDTVVVTAVDPVTEVKGPMHFFCRRWNDAQTLSLAFKSGAQPFDTHIESPLRDSSV